MAPWHSLLRPAACSLALLASLVVAQDDNVANEALTVDVVKALHPKLDANGDGRLSQSEFEEAGLAFRVKEAQDQVKVAFPQFDTDKDGKVSKQEFYAQVTAGDEAEPSAEQAAQYNNIFAAADADGDGALSEQEFMTIYNTETSPTMMKIGGRGMVTQFDTDGDGLVTKEEYDALEGKDDEFGQEAFDMLDANGDGTLDEEEMAHIVTGKHGSDKEMAKLIKYADKDGDGHVTVEELAAVHPELRDSASGQILSGWAKHVEL